MVERWRPQSQHIARDQRIADQQPKLSRQASIKKSTIQRARREERDAAKRMSDAKKGGATQDSFVNYALNLGIGTNNALSQSQYGFNPITRIRTLLDFIHRGSWLGGVAIDLLAEDMTREGIEITADIDPEDIELLMAAMTRLKIWKGLQSNIKWARLYGGSLAIFLIDGQDPSQPLRIESIGRNQFKGLMVVDRWMVEPDLQRLVKDFGPHLGLPEYYRIVSDAPAMRNQTIHYTRVIRLEGIELPYWQKIMENLWGLSVLERLYDRMVAFDSATQGAAQLVYKSYVRTYAIKGLTDAATLGGQALNGITARIEFMRKYQGIEGISLIDANDKFEAHQSTGFSGISDALIQFGQQLSGALQIPLVRLFGQSPAGLNSTGESDLRTYYDNIRQMQERDLREGVEVILRILSRSLGIALPEDFNFNFVSLWQMDESEKVDVADKASRLAIEVEASGLISPQTALKELQNLARTTGRWTTITDEMIAEADDEVSPPEANAPQMGPDGQPLPPGQQPEGGPQEGEGGEGPPQPGKPSPEASKPGAGGINLKGLEQAKQVRRLLGGGDRAIDQYSLPYSEIGGLQVVIEQRSGTIRSGEGWSVIMPCDYGYLRRIGSAEGSEEWLDCFVGPQHSSRDVWVIDALNPETGKFDEHKLMLGFKSSRDAIDCFKKAYDDGAAKRIGAVKHFDMSSLAWKNWLAAGDKTKPVAMQERAA